MDFTQALSYPFKSIPKVISIVLVMTIAIAVFLGMVLNSFDMAQYLEGLQYWQTYEDDYKLTTLNDPSLMGILGLLGLFVVIVVERLWLSGYNIRVIRSAVDGYDQLPNVSFKQDLLRGFYLMLSGILYGLVFVPFFIIFMMLIGMTSGPRGESGLAGVLFCSGFLISIPVMFLMGWAYFIGMARAAVDDNNSAMFQIWTNLRLARENWKDSLSLTGYQILLGLTYAFLSQFISNAIQMVASPFAGGGWNNLTILITFLIPLMLWLGMSIIQQFSDMHLVAQYAYKIGLVEHVDDDFDIV